MHNRAKQHADTALLAFHTDADCHAKEAQQKILISVWILLPCRSHFNKAGACAAIGCSANQNGANDYNSWANLPGPLHQRP